MATEASMHTNGKRTLQKACVLSLSSVLATMLCCICTTGLALVSPPALAGPQQDCIEDGGQAICTEPEERPISGANDSQASPDKYIYGMCDENAASIGRIAQWCAAEGGTWVVTGGGTQDCQGLPAVYPGVGTAIDEGAAVAASDRFAQSSSCTKTLSNDTGWGLSNPSDQLCSSGIPVTQNGVNVLDFRKRTYTGPCGGTVEITRSRRLQCPDPAARRTNANGDIQCFMPVQECHECLKSKNPVDLATGNKSQAENDYRSADGLEFTRYYTSQNRYRPRGTGPWVSNEQDYWRTSYARKLIPIINSAYAIAAVQREDGSVTYFNSSGAEVINRTGGGDRLTNTGSGWKLVRENSDVEYYDYSGRVTSVVTRVGVSTTLGYDSSGHLTSILNSFGRSLTLGYDANGQLATLTLPDGSQIQYAHDTLGRPTSVTYSDGTTRSYVYENSDNSWLLTGIVDENNIRFGSYSYNNMGQVSSESHAGGVEHYSFTYGDPTQTTMNSVVVDPLGKDRQYLTAYSAGVFRLKSSQSYCEGCPNINASSFDANGNRTSRTNLNNKQTTYVFDLTQNLETSRTEAAGTTVARTITTTWDPTFRLPATITELNRLTAFTYDASGNVLTRTITDTSVTPNKARTWTYTYDSYGHVLTEDGPRTDVSDVTTYKYYNCSSGGACGQIETVADALGHVTTFNTYNADGNPLTITDPNGVVTTLTYDGRQRLASRTTAGETTLVTYWPTGLLKRVTRPDGSFLQYVYDDAHRLTEIDDSLGDKIVYTLDAGGNHLAESRYDPFGALVQTQAQVFTTFGQLWQSLTASQADTQATLFTYDNQGNQTRVDAPMGRSVITVVDALNRASQVTDPSGVTQFAYDANDNLTSVTDPRHLVTQYAYTGFGEVKTLTSPDTGVTTSQYDSGGNLSTVANARGATNTYTYDALNRVSTVTYSLGGVSDQVITYGYDSGTNGIGRITSASDANQSVAWTYDSLGRVIGKSWIVGSVAKSTAYSYTGGLLSSMTLPSGTVVNYVYDSNGQISGMTLGGSPATTVLNNVLYDAFGPTGGWTWGNGTLAVRVRDLDGRITQIDSAGSTSLTYFDDGRISEKLDDSPNLYTSPPGTTTLTIASNSNRVTSTSGALARSYSYDGAGNTLAVGSAVLTYNDAGRLAYATQAGVTTTYLYNALGQRVRKSNSSGSVIFAYDEAGHLIGEYDSSGALIEETLWLDETPVAILKPNGSGGTDVFYVHTDQLNTPRRVSRPSDNAIVWQWNSDPFGVALPNEDADGDATAFSYNLRFAGQYYDAETGLNYNYFRDYDPATGRYIESDPIGLDGGLNTYAYVGSDPIDDIDPLGLESGAAYRAELRHDGWRGPPPPGSAGLVRPEVKSYLCKLIDQCNGDLQCVWKHIDQARKSDLKNGSWYNPTWREAENWAYTAGWDGWQSSALAINLHALHKYLPYPLVKTTPPSADAWSAGLAGRAHQHQTPEQLKEWCGGCSLH